MDVFEGSIFDAEARVFEAKSGGPRGRGQEFSMQVLQRKSLKPVLGTHIYTFDRYKIRYSKSQPKN